MIQEFPFPYSNDSSNNIHSQPCPQPRLSVCLIKSKAPNGDTILNNKYRLLNKLGQGSQAKVKLAMLINDFFDDNYIPQYFAVKIFVKPYLKKQRSFNRSQSNTSNSSSGSSRRSFSFITALDEVYQEIEIMKKLDHPNIVKLYEIIDDPNSEKLYLIMPVADYGECISWDERSATFQPNHRLQAQNISKSLKASKDTAEYYDEEQIKRMAEYLINALNYLHTELNIVHRDIKPQNIMVDEAGVPLLADFGKARFLNSDDEDLTTSMEGTYTFLPPECCSFDSTTYSMKKADIWALGITLYILTFNQFPFNVASTEIDLMETICDFQLDFKGRQISPDLEQMLTMMLEKDPLKRASLAQLQNCRFLKQQTISQQNGIDKMEERKTEERFFQHSDSFALQLKPSFTMYQCQEGDSPRFEPNQHQKAASP